MTVSKDNKRVLITVPNDLYDKIKDIADKENRSISNYIVTAVKREIEKEAD